MVCARSRPTRRTEVLAVAVPAAVMLAVGLWGLDRGGIWRDEAVTFQVARRTVPQIWRLLHGVDAVHGLYYLVMHAVLAVRPGEVVLRLPSVCAAAAAAGMVAALGVRLARPRVGLWAGLLYAVTPLAGHYAQEGRSYALVAAGAAGATLLLARTLDGGTPRMWWAYGGVVAATCLLHELAVLVLCAHALTLALLRSPRAVWRSWTRAAGGAVTVLLPLVLESRRQSRQVEWLPVPDRESAESLLRAFAVGPEGAVFWGCVTLMAVGLLSGRTAAVTAPVMLVPPALLMLFSQVMPLYHERYVLYALAGAPLLVAAGPTCWSAGWPPSPDVPHAHGSSPRPACSPWRSSSSSCFRCTGTTARSRTARTTSPPSPPWRRARSAPATRCCSCRRWGGGRRSRIRQGSAGRGIWR
ncbi:glycosyltransferase family 39 protein [Streptomyces sp. B21-106]|uniref:glycosyltransferase family 39 protein n=1 Tax=Streptomyces sp. B21-106 TaxID=3039418 RepID=UPI002FEF1540